MLIDRSHAAPRCQSLRPRRAIPATISFVDSSPTRCSTEVPLRLDVIRPRPDEVREISNDLILDVANDLRPGDLLLSPHPRWQVPSTPLRRNDLKESGKGVKNALLRDYVPELQDPTLSDSNDLRPNQCVADAGLLNGRSRLSLWTPTLDDSNDLRPEVPEEPSRPLRVRLRLGCSEDRRCR